MIARENVAIVRGFQSDTRLKTASKGHRASHCSYDGTPCSRIFGGFIIGLRPTRPLNTCKGDVQIALRRCTALAKRRQAKACHNSSERTNRANAESG
ncbi:unnamed protein product [Zymoseptoria tritici ST99CH_3D1]|nr:unnamed protein product [Zymoseptoria tritici ST99CH_3D1]